MVAYGSPKRTPSRRSAPWNRAIRSKQCEPSRRSAGSQMLPGKESFRRKVGSRPKITLVGRRRRESRVDVTPTQSCNRRRNDGIRRSVTVSFERFVGRLSTLGRIYCTPEPSRSLPNLTIFLRVRVARAHRVTLNWSRFTKNPARPSSVPPSEFGRSPPFTRSSLPNNPRTPPAGRRPRSARLSPGTARREPARARRGRTASGPR